MPTIDEIRRMSDGSLVPELIALVASKNELTINNGPNAGKAFYKLKLTDSTAAMVGTCWPEIYARHRELIDSLTSGDHVKVVAKKSTFRDAPELTITAIEKVLPADLPAGSLEYRPSSSRPVEDMLNELDSAAASIESVGLRNLLKTVFEDKGTRLLFSRGPAAEKMHHAYIGGLIEHTLSVARLCRSALDVACAYYGDVDQLTRDIAVTGALLHDLGKIREQDAEMGGYTELGNDIGHIVLGYEMVMDAARTSGCLAGEASVLQRLGHVILSHHGKKEWGSPVEPKTIEAILVHRCDDTDAHVMRAMEKHGREREKEAAKDAARAASYLAPPELEPREPKITIEPVPPMAELPDEGHSDDPPDVDIYPEPHDTGPDYDPFDEPVTTVIDEATLSPHVGEQVLLGLLLSDSEASAARTSAAAPASAAEAEPAGLPDEAEEAALPAASGPYAEPAVDEAPAEEPYPEPVAAAGAEDPFVAPEETEPPAFGSDGAPADAEADSADAFADETAEPVGLPMGDAYGEAAGGADPAGAEPPTDDLAARTPDFATSPPKGRGKKSVAEGQGELF